MENTKNPSQALDYTLFTFLNNDNHHGLSLPEFIVDRIYTTFAGFYIYKIEFYRFCKKKTKKKNQHPKTTLIN